MATGQTVASALIALLPVVAGGLIGVLGGLAGNAFSHHLSRKESRALERRNKLEQVVIAICETEVWLKREENRYLYEGPENLDHSPIIRIEALVGLHFPELHDAALHFYSSSQTYRTWMMGCRRDADASGSSIASQPLFAQHSAYYTPFAAAREILLLGAQERMAAESAP